ARRAGIGNTSFSGTLGSADGRRSRLARNARRRSLSAGEWEDLTGFQRHARQQGEFSLARWGTGFVDRDGPRPRALERDGGFDPRRSRGAEEHTGSGNDE